MLQNISVTLIHLPDRCDTLTLNPYNAVTLLGHTNGTVTMWSPTMCAPAPKALLMNAPSVCHCFSKCARP